MKCKTCNKLIKATESKVCNLCTGNYHYYCLGITLENYSKESKQSKANWKCPDCRTSEKRIDNTRTPSGHQDPCSPTHRQSIIDNSVVDELKEYFEAKLKEATTTILSQVRSQLSVETKVIHKEFEEVKASINYTNSQFEELSRLVNEKTKIIENLKSENEELRSQVSIINIQLNNIEQHSRACNIEIQCVPESKTENLLTTIKQLGQVVSREINNNEIVDFHRVPKLNQQTNRPRAIVAKLSSPRVRDEILVAVRKFNKTHNKDKLHCGHLGITGSKEPVYVAEHLSPMNKKLHAAARVTVREKKYEFLWVRNGKIFVRKDISSKALLISSEDVLKNL